MRTLNVVGFDPSLNNWGIATGVLTDGKVTVNTISVCNPVLPTGKQTRQNSTDLAAAEQLAAAAFKASRGADAIFVEVPVGSQSARAMASYGVCVGVLGALRAMGIPFFEVTATEVKLALASNKTATKAQMIAAAEYLHPLANWPRYTKNGASHISESKAEHMADAIGAIYAGIQLATFKQLLAFSKPLSMFENQTPHPIGQPITPH